MENGRGGQGKGGGRGGGGGLGARAGGYREGSALQVHVLSDNHGRIQEP